MKFFQKLGKSIMLPVAILPVAAILMGISNWIQGAAGDNVVSTFLGAAGGALLGPAGDFLKYRIVFQSFARSPSCSFSLLTTTP